VRDRPTRRSCSMVTCVGWCQFGTPDELPRIKFARAYREIDNDPPDWRITCFFVDRAYRHKGVAAAAR
jgi:hypothetical protein